MIDAVDHAYRSGGYEVAADHGDIGVVQRARWQSGGLRPQNFDVLTMEYFLSDSQDNKKATGALV